jgi:hypothetical protein
MIWEDNGESYLHYQRRVDGLMVVVVRRSLSVKLALTCGSGS